MEPDLHFLDRVEVVDRRRSASVDPPSTSMNFKNADVVLTARFDGLLVGVSRALTDFAGCTYLSDLAVDEKRRPKRPWTGTDWALGGDLHTALIPW
jgi:hypothetical protein